MLGLLGSPDQEDYHDLSSLREVDAVSGAIVDAKLADAFAYRLYVSEVAKRYAAKTNLDALSCFLITEFS